MKNLPIIPFLFLFDFSLSLEVKPCWEGRHYGLFSGTGSSAVYDGESSIYIFGGYDSPAFSGSDIVQLNINDGTATLAGNFSQTFFGSVERNSNGDIFLFGGSSGIEDAREIYKSNSNEFMTPVLLPTRLSQGRQDFTTEVVGNSIFILGGRGPGISTVSLKNST